MDINIQGQAFGYANLVPRKLKSYAVETMKTAKKVGQEDPRRAVHPAKVGLGLTIVSLFYYFRPLYDGSLGESLISVFRCGTLSKSLNRGFATLVAGALGLGAEYLAASTSTFTRFFPNVKRRYDYGVLIFILTFTMVAVSGFGSEVLLGLGDENSKAFSKSDHDKSFLESYKSVLNSKANEESLANFAWWEPPHGKFKFGHPWKQYVKIGALSGKALRSLSAAMTQSTRPSPAVKAHAQNYRAAARDLKAALDGQPDSKPGGDLYQLMPLLVVASVLIDVSDFTDEIALAAGELSEKARFGDQKSHAPPEKPQVLHRGVVSPVDDDCGGGGVSPEKGGRRLLE
ncbi:aluminum-activated malate transporter [Striga asiatica]|uniref:Aluminum-activated malate transporter n=1 Tax=Striga asiatica TaxID=4170 RepID=A0A5A7PLK6_STRAF|nr:aluminum-activated malate transporter [Striga asiatica]